MWGNVKEDPGIVQQGGVGKRSQQRTTDPLRDDFLLAADDNIFLMLELINLGYEWCNLL